MKKLVLLFLIAFTGITSIQAQDGVKFGVKAGANFANLIGDDAEPFDLKSRTNLHAGAVLNVGLNDWLALQPELVYSMQGYEGEADGVSFDGQLDYVNVPVMVDFTVAEGFSLQVGPQIGINVTAKEEAENGGEIELDAQSVVIETAFGAQYELPVGLFFQARYAAGMTQAINDVSAFNSVLSLSVGWFFN